MKKVLLALLCAGCTACAVGPDFRRPAPPEVSGYTPPSSETSIEAQRVQQLVRQRLVEGADLPAQWWALFESAPLNRLVERWIPVPRVLHPYPMQRFDASHPRREPYA